jgi:hypothetical protein
MISACFDVSHADNVTRSHMPTKIRAAKSLTVRILKSPFITFSALAQIDRGLPRLSVFHLSTVIEKGNCDNRRIESLSLSQDSQVCLLKDNPSNLSTKKSRSISYCSLALGSP